MVSGRVIQINRKAYPEFRKKYPDAIYFAKSHHPHPRASGVDHVYSTVLIDGERVWAFETVSERDRFVRDYTLMAGLHVIPCEIPTI